MQKTVTAQRNRDTANSSSSSNIHNAAAGAGASGNGPATTLLAPATDTAAVDEERGGNLQTAPVSVSSASISPTNPSTLSSASFGGSQHLAFAEKRARLLKMIDHAREMLFDLKGPSNPSASSSDQILRYPPENLALDTESSDSGSLMYSSNAEFKILKLHLPSRNMIILKAAATAGAATAAAPASVGEAASVTTSSFQTQQQYLSLETGEDVYVSQLLTAKINEAVTHLDRLQTRIADIRSRVFVTVRT